MRKGLVVCDKPFFLFMRENGVGDFSLHPSFFSDRCEEKELRDPYAFLSVGQPVFLSISRKRRFSSSKVQKPSKVSASPGWGGKGKYAHIPCSYGCIHCTKLHKKGGRAVLRPCLFFFAFRPNKKATHSRRLFASVGINFYRLSG